MIFTVWDYFNVSAIFRSVIRFRVSAEDKRAIENLAVKRGFDNVSGFLRRLALGR
ncbi:MAG: hypothetical protein NTZ80_00565 [Patescibacteria group bacterium]|nr:hypothetical protein [Patescibacteria group bacterium]